MPIYDYKCKTCGKEFEYTQRITEPALTKCPADVCECKNKGQGDVVRKISKNIGLVFNGSGFYLTDYVHKKENFSSANHSKTKSNDSNTNNSSNIASATTSDTNAKSTSTTADSSTK